VGQIKGKEATRHSITGSRVKRKTEQQEKKEKKGRKPFNTRKGKENRQRQDKVSVRICTHQAKGKGPRKQEKRQLGKKMKSIHHRSRG